MISGDLLAFVHTSVDKQSNGAPKVVRRSGSLEGLGDLVEMVELKEQGCRRLIKWGEVVEACLRRQVVEVRSRGAGAVKNRERWYG